MNLLFAFFAGMFMANSIPHLIPGIMGKTHMTPLAKNSSALINILWGAINLIAGAWFFNISNGQITEILSFNEYSISFWIGALVLAVIAAVLFSNPKARFPWFKK